MKAKQFSHQLYFFGRLPHDFTPPTRSPAPPTEHRHRVCVGVNTPQASTHRWTQLQQGGVRHRGRVHAAPPAAPVAISRPGGRRPQQGGHGQRPDAQAAHESRPGGRQSKGTTQNAVRKVVTKIIFFKTFLWKISHPNYMFKFKICNGRCEVTNRSGWFSKVANLIKCAFSTATSHQFVRKHTPHISTFSFLSQSVRLFLCHLAFVPFWRLQTGERKSNSQCVSFRVINHAKLPGWSPGC